MARNSLDERIAKAQAKQAQSKEKIRLLQQRMRAEERKAKTKRLIERGMIIESLIDGADALTNEEIRDILTDALIPIESENVAQDRHMEAPPPIIVIIMRTFLDCIRRRPRCKGSVKGTVKR